VAFARLRVSTAITEAGGVDKIVSEKMFSTGHLAPGCVSGVRMVAPTLSFHTTHHLGRQKARLSMPNRHGNPDWTRTLAVPPSGASAFEHLVATLRLSPEDYENSTVLRNWVRKNKNH